ncbi:MAG: hypothetical protein JKY52_17945 [Flavobacteriales bacterium]|nr:hypothetical protein [Flavobacteriales bacterium]
MNNLIAEQRKKLAHSISGKYLFCTDHVQMGFAAMTSLITDYCISKLGKMLNASENTLEGSAKILFN